MKDGIVLHPWYETCCGIILPLFTQGERSHEFPNVIRLGNKE
jgi:hypothetical protein